MNHFQRQNTVTVMACIAMAAVAFFFYFEDSSASDKASPKVLIAFGEARKKDKNPKPEKSVKPELATPESRTIKRQVNRHNVWEPSAPDSDQRYPRAMGDKNERR